MNIQRLFLQNFRIISELEIQLEPGLNLFTGLNGAGKTSVLEAVHVLSLGKTFRQGRVSTFIQNGQSAVTVGASLTGSSQSESKKTMGVKIEASCSLYKLDGQKKRNISELSETLPVIVYDPSTATTISSDSVARRRFMDWGCFQTDPTFITKWRSYKRALSQRNSLLKQHSPKSLVLAWDNQLAPLAEELSKSRKEYLSRLENEFNSLLKHMHVGFEIHFPFKDGWSTDSVSTSLNQQLIKSYDLDCRRGYTRLGSHRDDFVLKINNKTLSNHGSRGQIKIVVLLLKIAQASLLQKDTNRKTILLFDDLPSELDDRNLTLVLEIIDALNTQLLLTSIEPNPITSITDSTYQLFHVKHGSIIPE